MQFPGLSMKKVGHRHARRETVDMEGWKSWLLAPAREVSCCRQDEETWS
jgi:hypothetical protein